MAQRNRMTTAILCSGALLWLTSHSALAAEPVMPMRVVQLGEVQYISGGESKAERAELSARLIDFRLQVSFTGQDGSALPKHVEVKLLPQGPDHAARPIKLTTAGPLLLVNMPSGSYKLIANVPGAHAVESLFELHAGEIEQLEVKLDPAAQS
jgi:hypothetical protein